MIPDRISEIMSSGSFAPAVVCGDYRKIRKPCGNCPHRRTLCAVTVSAASEENDDPAVSGKLPDGEKDVLKRIRRMGKVDVNRKVVCGQSHPLKPPPDTRKAAYRSAYHLRGYTLGKCGSGCLPLCSSR